MTEDAYNLRFEGALDYQVIRLVSDRHDWRYVGVTQILLRKLVAAFDFVYIDGSHQAADVLEDAVLSFRLLRPGGILIFDDYLWRNYPQPQLNPALGIDSFLAAFAGRYKLVHKNHQLAIEKTGS